MMSFRINYVKIVAVHTRQVPSPSTRGRPTPSSTYTCVSSARDHQRFSIFCRFHRVKTRLLHLAFHYKLQPEFIKQLTLSRPPSPGYPAVVLNCGGRPQRCFSPVALLPTVTSRFSVEAAHNF